MFDLYDGLPAKTHRILHDMNLRRRTAIEHRIKPIVFLQALSGLVFIATYRDLADRCASFHLNESYFDGSLRVFGMRLPRDQVKAPIVLLHTFHSPASGFLMGCHGANSDLFNFFVAHHRSDARRHSLRMRQYPGTPMMPNVCDSAMPLLLQFLAPPLKTPIQLIQTVFRGLHVRGQ